MGSQRGAGWQGVKHSFKMTLTPSQDPKQKSESRRLLRRAHPRLLPLPPSSSGSTSVRGQQAAAPRGRPPAVLRDQISSVQADRKAVLALNLQWCKVFVFDKITRKTSYSQVRFGNTAICSLHRHWSTSLAHSLRSQKNCCNTELQNTMNITVWCFHIY